MSKIRKIAKNSFLLLLARVISIILGFIYTVYIARYLGAEGYGILSFALAFSGIFGVFTDLGFSTLITREVARNRSIAAKYLGNIILIEIILAGFTLAFITICINIMDYPTQTINVVYLISASIILNSFVKIFNSIFQAFENLKYESIGIALSSIIMITGVLFSIKENQNIIIFAGLYLLTSGTVLGYTFLVYIKNFETPKIEIDWKFWKNIIKEALPFGITGIFVTVFYWIDTIMLSVMKGDEVVGWYNAAYRLIVSLLIIPSIINVSIFPSMSLYYISSKNSLKFIFQKYFKYMNIVGIPLCIGTILLADRIIQLIYGVEYKNSIIALQILIFSTVFIFIGSPFCRLLEASNKQMIITKITGICMLENIILNLLVIPKYGYIGASVTTVITELTSLVIGVTICSKIGYKISKNGLIDLMKVIIASLLMGVLIIQSNEINLLILIVLSIIFYFITLYAIKEFDGEDKILFKQTIKTNIDTKI